MNRETIQAHARAQKVSINGIDAQVIGLFSSCLVVDETGKVKIGSTIYKARCYINKKQSNLIKVAIIRDEKFLCLYSINNDDNQDEYVSFR